MSDPSTTIGTTLTGGIQDISALLPLLGTDQCENHVGSALDGGYLYAAAAPLSLFGSLGIVKIGISILISSISIPKISISFRKFSIKFSPDRWLGARTLHNAGFKPVGTVAPLIAMDGTGYKGRYKAETRLIQILEEKHIEDPENVSIKWRSREWNIKLVVYTTVAGVISGTPYIALLLRNSGPSVVHTPWIVFPLLRTVGSCLAAVCCQFLIQLRVISLMKNRIIFMVMNRIRIDDPELKHNHAELDLGDQDHFQWDADLPAEQCLWSLERFLSSQGSSTQPNGPREQGAHVSITMQTLSFSYPQNIREKLGELRKEHFRTPAFDRAFVLISWIILCLSLPAAIAGYIGCFTLVSNSQENGPLIWLGMEAALSIIRILVWAFNPKFDEETDITVKLKLTKDPPLVTTEKNAYVIKSTGNNTLPLVPERRFLEWVTPYTGPLEQFKSSENLALYFTLTGGSDGKCLYMTVFDFNKRIAVTLYRESGPRMYVNDATVTYNHIASEMEAKLHSAIYEEHPWRTNDVILFDALANYYNIIIHALNRTHLRSPALDNLQPGFMAVLQNILRKRSESDNISPDQGPNPDLVAPLRWKWNLLPKSDHHDQSPDQALESPALTVHDKSYLGRGYEHHLKTALIENWSEWIVQDMDGIRSEARNDCHHALADPVSERAKWELTELDMQLAWEWTRRELSLLASSIALEGILDRRMKECIDKVVSQDGAANATEGKAVTAEEQENRRLKKWMQSEFVIGQQKRLEKERGKTKERMEKGMKAASERAESEGRLWRDQGRSNPENRWGVGLDFIDSQWCTVFEHRYSGLMDAAYDDLDKLGEALDESMYLDKGRATFAGQVRGQFKHWHSQHENERREKDATIQRIADSDAEQLDDAYRYPWPHDSDDSPC